MATKTPNYNLIKPDPSDYYDIAVFNDNADKIDTALASKRNSDDPITVGWDDVTEKPTDIAGYGILDAVTSALKNPPSTNVEANIPEISSSLSTFSGPAGLKSYGYINIPMESGSARVQILADSENNGALYFRRVEVGAGPWAKLLSAADLPVELGTFTLSMGGNSTTDNTYVKIGNTVNVQGKIPASGTATQASNTISGLPFSVKTGTQVQVVGIGTKIAMLKATGANIMPIILSSGGQLDSGITFDGSFKGFPGGSSTALNWPELYFNFTYQI